MTVALRDATPADVPRLQAWDRAPHVVACHTDDPAAYDPADEAAYWEDALTRRVDWRATWIIEADGRPVGVVHAIDPAREDTHYWGEVPDGLRALDIWIGEADALGQGIGGAAMREALDRCFAPPDVTAVWIDPLASNTAARRFYERLGFAFVEQRRFGEDDCAVYRLDRAAWAEGASARPAR